jgi:hypothetical protein
VHSLVSVSVVGPVLLQTKVKPAKCINGPGQLTFNVDGCDADGALEIPNHFRMQGFALATPEQTASTPLAGTAAASNSITVTPLVVPQLFKFPAIKMPPPVLTTWPDSAAVLTPLGVISQAVALCATFDAQGTPVAARAPARQPPQVYLSYAFCAGSAGRRD